MCVGGEYVCVGERESVCVCVGECVWVTVCVSVGGECVRVCGYVCVGVRVNV